MVRVKVPPTVEERYRALKEREKSERSSERTEKNALEAGMSSRRSHHEETVEDTSEKSDSDRRKHQKGKGGKKGKKQGLSSDPEHQADTSARDSKEEEDREDQQVQERTRSKSGKRRRSRPSTEPIGEESEKVEAKSKVRDKKVVNSPTKSPPSRKLRRSKSERAMGPEYEEKGVEAPGSSASDIFKGEEELDEAATFVHSDPDLTKEKPSSTAESTTSGEIREILKDTIEAELIPTPSPSKGKDMETVRRLSLESQMQEANETETVSESSDETSTEEDTSDDSDIEIPGLHKDKSKSRSRKSLTGSGSDTDGAAEDEALVMKDPRNFWPKTKAQIYYKSFRPKKDVIPRSVRICPVLTCFSVFDSPGTLKRHLLEKHKGMVKKLSPLAMWTMAYNASCEGGRYVDRQMKEEILALLQDQENLSTCQMRSIESYMDLILAKVGVLSGDGKHESMPTHRAFQHALTTLSDTFRGKLKAFRRKQELAKLEKINEKLRTQQEKLRQKTEKAYKKSSKK